MPISQDHHNLFQSSNALDKLTLLQSLLDAGALTSDEALALLNSIHTELEQPEGHTRAVYTQYAEVMESLRIKTPNIYHDISTKWQQLHSVLQTKTDHEAASEDHEPTRKNETVASLLLSRLPQKSGAKKGFNKRNDSEEIEGEAKEEMEAEETEEEPEEETEEKEEVEKDEEKETEEEKEESEEEEEKEETEEEEEKEEGKEEEKEETEEEEEKEESEEEEKEEEKEESEEEKEEDEEKESKKEETEEHEKEEEHESSAHESGVEEEHNSKEEADHMAAEAAEAAEESEHVEVETETEPLEIETPAQQPMDFEETDSSFGSEAEPPMEIPE
jgi:hypothetical protein